MNNVLLQLIILKMKTDLILNLIGMRAKLWKLSIKLFFTSKPYRELVWLKIKQ